MNQEMKATIIRTCGCALLGVGLVGCQTIGQRCARDPYSIPMTSNDEIVIKDQFTKVAPKDKIKVAVVSVRDTLSPATGDMIEAEKRLAAEVGEKFSMKLARSEFFEVADRESLDLVAAEAKLSGADDPSEIVQSDTVLTIKSKIRSAFGPGRKSVKNPQEAVGIGVESKVRFFETDSKKVRLSEVFSAERVFSDTKTGFTDKLIAECVDQMTSPFIQKVMAIVKPESRVVETRGDCKVAKIEVGKWHLDFVVGSRVRFYTHKEDLNGNVERKTFARGHIVAADTEFAWVEIDNPETAGVRVGHCAELDQTVRMR